MTKPAPWTAALLALIAAAAFTLTTIAHPVAAAAVRVMPLGDSITGSPGCWRALLWNRLQAAGHSNVDFVGTLPTQVCGVAHDGDNEGHGGFLATNVANQNQLVGWLAVTRPDIVVMHFGTNDVWSAIAPATILAAFSRLVDQMRASNPAMKVLVAKIIPMNPAGCAPCGQRVVDFNAAIPGWAAGKTTAQSPITVVDQWTGFSTASDAYDGVHPNAAGDQKIADRWFTPLAAALTGTQPTTSPTASPSPSPTASPTPDPGGRSCSATYRIVNQWPGGFQGEVVVTNTGATGLTGWTTAFTFPNGQTITQLWNAGHTQTGSTVTARNLSWNGDLSPAATTTFGFLADWSGVNAAPAPGCTAS